MKKIISLLVLTILMSSCGNRLSIVKRHYTKGFYVEKGKKQQCENLVTAETKNRFVEKMQPSIVGFSLNEKVTDIGLSASATTDFFHKTERKSSFQSQIKRHHPKTAENEIAIKKVSTIKSLILSEKVKEKSAKGSEDTDLIIMVILCFFPVINLIAMYLHDGKKITMNFWIDLILDVLFFFPGIIFALLVVLGVFSLA